MPAGAGEWQGRAGRILNPASALSALSKRVLLSCGQMGGIVRVTASTPDTRALERVASLLIQDSQIEDFVIL
jgi:hypothetical protein